MAESCLYKCTNNLFRNDEIPESGSGQWLGDLASNAVNLVGDNHEVVEGE